MGGSRAVRAILREIHDEADYIVGTETEDEHYRGMAIERAELIKQLSKKALALKGTGIEIEDDSVDWLMLREQRNTTLRVREDIEHMDSESGKEIRHLEGLINFLDFLIDKALDANLLPEISEES